ncbi:MAG: type II secretion system F family protein [Candidatus Microthrix sp.]|mgnify:FL=1|jgi:tight adherence protein C|nr:type II secretion system F family protein [Candidatus Microthrix sp.]MBK9558689.1 type II secretion system F family protein [Candidatus Microthrix sp.]MBP7595379.1 type II secretion system F family protein [Candidatus Microthrix sp.]
MTRAMALAFLGLMAGSVLIISSFPRLNPAPLAQRLRAYLPGGGAAVRRQATLSGLRTLVAPLAKSWGDSLARTVGLDDDVGDRLLRLHRDDDATAFRVRQLMWSLTGLIAGAAIASALKLPVVLSLFVLAASPILVFLLTEQHLARLDERRRTQVLHELPVVAEQLAMHLSAGYSLSASVARLGRRSSGACAEDLRVAARRIRGGASEVSALREWAELSKVEAVSRLVGVLALNQEAGDLGTLIGMEARSIRREVHRELMETIERREQMVWIPVTVATLVPGVVFLVVPFIHALSRFTG